MGFLSICRLLLIELGPGGSPIYVYWGVERQAEGTGEWVGPPTAWQATLVVVFSAAT